jgi:Type I restriction modification DNA specificity domain
MNGLRRLTNGKWSVSPALFAARQILICGTRANFSLCQLGSAATFLNGTSYDCDQLCEIGGVPIIRISNITNPSSRYLHTREPLDQRFLVRKGDLLVSWSASFKSIVWPGPEGFLNQHIFKVMEHSGFDRRYLRHAIEASFAEMQENVVGIGMMHLRRSDFLGHEIPSPPLQTQKAIAEFLDHLESEMPGRKPDLPPILEEERRIVARIEELATKIQEARALRQQADEEVEAFIAARVSALFNGNGR